MKRQPRPFKQTDVARAVRAVLAAGIDIEKIEVEPDKITIIASRHDEQTATAGKNEWDDL